MTQPLLILAVDQRPWLTKALYGHTGEASPRERANIAEGKHIVLDGLLAARGRLPDPAAGAILVDSLLGPGVPERARAAGVTLAMPIERGGFDVYETEPEDLAGYLRHHAPDQTKVLVRYNVEGGTEVNAVQRSRLAEAAKVAHDTGSRFLFEILVPATDQQLARVDGDAERFDHELRPELILRGMEELSREVDVDVWKVEHLAQPEHYRAAVEVAAGHDATCILLGAGADQSTVNGWLSTAAAEGFAGFAIGRSIWWHAMRAHLAGEISRDDAVAAVAERYRAFVDVFLGT